MRKTNYNNQFQYMAGCCAQNKNSLPALIIIGAQVIDEMGDPVSGANVIIEGTTIGVQADINGYFTLPNVPIDAVLDFSYASIITKIEVSKIGDTVRIKTIGSLDEVVITAPNNNLKYLGYATLAVILIYAITRPRKTIKATI